ncbi:MAG: DMT family transporter [Paracoccaceae bacterium]
MHSDNARGAFFMMVATASFVVSDTIMKLLNDAVPMFQVLFLRGIMVSAILGLLAMRAGALRVALSGRDRRLVVQRTAADMVATWFFLQALYNMPIANMTAIFQSVPLTITLGAALFLGEKVGWRRMVAIGFGFAGVLLIVRPASEGFDLYSIYALCAIAAVTLRDLTTRQMARHVPTEIVALLNALGVMGMGAIGCLFLPWTPTALPVLLMMVATAVLVVAGYLLSVLAVRTGELSVVAPLRYTGLVWALLIGLFVFGEWPDGLTLLGAALIVGMGLFTFYRERQIKAAKARAAR